MTGITDLFSLLMLTVPSAPKISHLTLAAPHMYAFTAANPLSGFQAVQPRQSPCLAERNLQVEPSYTPVRISLRPSLPRPSTPCSPPHSLRSRENVTKLHCRIRSHSPGPLHQLLTTLSHNSTALSQYPTAKAPLPQASTSDPNPTPTNNRQIQSHSH